jgi:DNA replication and repair protein RecF
MYVRRLDLANFRNFDQLHIEFPKGINMIIGPNASGKTNMIEAIYYLTMARSFKKANDENLIKFDTNLAQIRLNYEKDNISNLLEVDINKKGKLVKYNSQKQTSVAKIIGNLVSVVYSPISVNLFRSEPQERRKFIDSSLCLLSLDYMSNLAEFKKILKERNNSLYMEDEIVINILTKRLIDISYNIYVKRNKFIQLLNKEISDIYYKLFDTTSKLTLEYVTNLSKIVTKEEFIKDMEDKFNSIKSEERKKKTTLIGPQRDDLIAYLDSKEVYSYSSQGQNRLVVLALYLSLANILKQQYKSEPILLLDDVLSDLDIKRKQLLIEFLKQKEQVFITTTDNEFVQDGINAIYIEELLNKGV